MSSKPAVDTVIDTKDILVSYIASGSKPNRNDWRIGSEHEKFVFHRGSNAPLAYEGAHGLPGIKDVLNAFVAKGWTPLEENGFLIAAKKEGASITLEPGGQFELSGAPLRTIHETCSETTAHLHDAKDIGDALNIGFLGLGFHPTAARDEIPVMPKARYDIMRAYMPKVGTLGLDMMLRTCTVQVNLDFADEADMVEKFRVSLALQPLATALFANSPFVEGKAVGFKSFRSHVWTDTDPDRTGMLPFVFEDGMGFERWVDHVLDVPMYFVKRDGKYIDASGQSFRNFIDGKLPALPGEKPVIADWEDHMTTLFPEVRLKTFLEMRGADGGPWSRLCALPALWVGLLYNNGIQKDAAELVKEWSLDDLAELRAKTPRDGLSGTFLGRPVKAWAKDMLDLSAQGLRRRALSGDGIPSEEGFLTSLQETVETGMTPADELIAGFASEWAGDASKTFAAMAY